MVELMRKMEILDAEYDLRLVSDAEYNRRLDEILKNMEVLRK